MPSKGVASGDPPLVALGLGATVEDAQEHAASRLLLEVEPNAPNAAFHHGVGRVLGKLHKRTGAGSTVANSLAGHFEHMGVGQGAAP